MGPLARWLRARAHARTPATPGTPTPAPTPLDERMMSRALKLAETASSRGEVPVGAVVYRLPQQGENADDAADESRILARNHNRREANADPAAHAEFLAITDACKAIGDWRLNDCALAVTLEPCPMCAGLIINARVGRVVYGADDPKAGACRSLYRITDDKRLNHSPVVIPGIFADKSSELLRDFFRKRREENRRSPPADDK